MWLPDVLVRWAWRQSEKEFDKKYRGLDICRSCKATIIKREYQDMHKGVAICLYASILLLILVVVRIMIL